MASAGTCGGIKWPAQQLNIAPTSGGFSFDCASAVSGVQSVGLSANFDLTPIFQLSQSEVYETNEALPQIEVTINKALDGAPMVYLVATQDSTSPSLFGRTPCFTNVALSMFPCTLDSASGTPNSVMVTSGVQVGSVSYTFTVDGPATEDVTLLGNNMIWKLNNGLTHPGLCSNVNPDFTNQINSISVQGCFAANNASPPSGVQFREDIIYGPVPSGSTSDLNGMVADPDLTILPPDVYGVSASGTNVNADVCVQSISVSVDLNREDINCLGKRNPQNRSITLPVTVTTDIEVISDYGHLVSATDYGVCADSTAQCDNVSNLSNRTIRIATCDGTRIYTGTKNKLSSVSRTGGDTAGGNLSVTYSYQTFNTLVVMHPNDPNPSAATWWAARSDYLVDV
jgi:hypothetical protein